MSNLQCGQVNEWITLLSTLLDSMNDLDDSELTVAIEHLASAIEELEEV